MPTDPAATGLPQLFQQFTTATFLAALVLTLVGPFKGRVGDAWLPLITMVTGVTLNVGLALVGGADTQAVVYAALAGVATSFIASGVYSHVTTVNQEAAKASYLRGLAALAQPVASPQPVVKLPADPDEAIVVPDGTVIAKPTEAAPAPLPMTAPAIASSLTVSAAPSGSLQGAVVATTGTVSSG